MERLDGKRIIVVGGTSGMGEVTVDGFSELGAKVIFFGRNEKAGNAIAKRSGAIFRRLDMTDHPAVKKVIDAAAAELGGLDSIFVPAAIQPDFSPAESIPETDFARTIDTNVIGTYLSDVAAFPYLKEKGGSIVNFTSATGFVGYPGRSHYAASKGAVAGWTRSIALEWGRYNIRVNMISPAIWTPMYEEARASMTPEQLKAHDESQIKTTPIGGKLGDPKQDYLPVAAFLASDSSRFMTGQTFCVDGGKLMMR